METRAMATAPKRARMSSPGAASPSSTETLQALLEEVRQLRQEQERMRAGQSRREEEFAEMAARLRRRDEETLQLSLSENFSSRDMCAGVTGFEESRARVSEEERNVRGRNVGRIAGATVLRSGDANIGENCSHPVVGFKLKPDTYDGSVSLREFFAQFDLVARANLWGEATKTVVLASCLRGKARSVLETVEDAESLEFSELKSKLELRFGEGLLSQDYCTQFSGRKQKFGEDFAAFGAELERLARLAYPECSYTVRDKIACTQFVASLTDGFVKRTLRLEGVSSLKAAIERAKAVKTVQGEFLETRKDFGNGKEKNGVLNGK